MRALLLVILAFVAVLAQVAVAPLFPLADALIEVPVVVLLLLAIFAGPYAVMIALPILVLFLGFSTNVEYEWLIAAYLPLLPCAAWIQRQHAIPQTPYVLVLIVALGAGAWARAVFSTVALASGASPDFGAVFVEIVLPGAAFDAIVLSVIYGLCRWVGWPARSLDLQQAEF